MSRQDYGAGSMIERSPGCWQVTVPLARDPRTGKRLRQRFAVRGTRRDAQRALRHALQQRDTGLSVPAEKISVADWLTAWLDRHRAEDKISARTHDRYRGIVEKHLVPLLGRLRLQALRPDHIADAKARWLSGRDTTAAQPLSGATIHKHLVILRKALGDAVSAGVIARNPADAVPAPSVKVRGERRALSAEEIAALLAVAAGTRYNVAIRFTLATGLREGELLGLKWEDVDFDAGTVQIRRAASYVNGTVTFGVPKTERSRRTIELSAATLHLLRTHRATQVEHRLQVGTAWREHGLVFPSLLGTPWFARAFYRDFRRVVAKADIEGVAGVNWHSLRHTAATQWIRHGADIFSVSRRLGHASAAFTMDVYGHLLKGQQRQAAEALDYLIAQS